MDSYPEPGDIVMNSFFGYCYIVSSFMDWYTVRKLSINNKLISGEQKLNRYFGYFTIMVRKVEENTLR